MRQKKNAEFSKIGKTRILENNKTLPKVGFPSLRKKILEDGNPIIEKMILNNETPMHAHSSRSAKDEVERDVPPTFSHF